MTHNHTNGTNDQSKTSTGKPSMPTVSDLTPRNELKGGVARTHSVGTNQTITVGAAQAVRRGGVADIIVGPGPGGGP